jgi:hypothetical protein
VASLDQVVQDPPEADVQDLVLQNRDWAAVHREVSQVVLQLAEEVAVLAAEQPVHLVKVAQGVNLRPENQSAPREKNSNKEVFQALVERLFQEEMAAPLSDCAAELRFRTLPTRLMPMLVS